MSKQELLSNNASYRFKIQNQKQTLLEKTEQDMYVAYNGGFFHVTMELITFLSVWEHDDLVLKDSYNTPILIEDVQGFKDMLVMRYREVMNEYREQYESLKRVRRVKDV